MRNEFNILNDIKNEIDSMEEVILTEEEKKRISSRVIKKLNKPRKKANKKVVIAASLALALTGTFALTNEDVIAQINSVGRKIENFFAKEDNSFKKYKKDIIQVVEDKGIKFMLHEAMVDDEELYISASVDYNDVDKSQLKTKYKGPLDIVPSTSDPKIQIYLNGEEQKFSGNGGSYKYNKDGTVDMLLTVDMANNNLDNIYDIKFKIDNMEAQIPFRDNELIKGDWELNFKVDGIEMANEMKTIKIEKEIEIEHNNQKIMVMVDELRVSPTSMRLKYSTNEYNDEGGRIGFKFFEENDKEVHFVSQGGGNDGLSHKWIKDRDISKMKITPVWEDWRGRTIKYTEFKENTIEINIK